MFGNQILEEKEKINLAFQKIIENPRFTFVNPRGFGPVKIFILRMIRSDFPHENPNFLWIYTFKPLFLNYTLESTTVFRTHGI